MEAAAARAAAGAGTAAAKGLYRWWRPKSDWASLAGIADGLAASVDQAEKQVQQELRAGQGAFMPVSFTAADRLQPENVISAEVDDIADYFELLENPRRMVVLGDPGAGKTVAATYLVRGLIQRRNELVAVTRRAAEPVPVRVNTAGWDGGQELSAWLVTRLEKDYELRANVAEKMVKAGMILPVLDGLDEMDDDITNGARARALLDRLNERDWAHRPAVVLCRSTEFDHLKQVGGDNGLHGAATVTLDPLTIGQPADYLARYRHRIGAKHPAWDRITTHLREHPDTPLAVTLRNPWMLGLTATTLHRTPQTAAALLDCPGPDVVRDGLFAAQIPAAIAGTDDTEQFRDYTPDNVEKWLHALARHLELRRDTGRNGTAIRLDEIWEIAGPTRVLILHALAAALLLGVITGLQIGPAAGLAFGLTFGLTVGSTRASSASRVAWKVPTRTRWRRALRVGLVVGLTAALMFGLLTGLVGGHAAERAIGVGLTAGLAFGLLFGLIFGVSTTPMDQLAIGTDARRLIRNDLQSTLFYSAMFGLAFGITVGAIIAVESTVGLQVGLQVGLVVGLAVGLVIGLAVGLVIGVVNARFFLASILFKITADFPSRPAAFLDWAHGSGLLRVNATAYQFRHQTYQQWLLCRPDTTRGIIPLTR